MIRRRFVFVEQKGKKLYVSPEFNGTQEEYGARGGSADSCDLSYKELYKLFQVAALDPFRKACEEAQGHYHSFLKDGEPTPMAELEAEQMQKLQADEAGVRAAQLGRDCCQSVQDPQQRGKYCAGTVRRAGCAHRPVSSKDRDHQRREQSHPGLSGRR